MKKYQELKLSPIDIKWKGREPSIKEITKQTQLMDCYNWYNYFYNAAIWKGWALAYNETIGNKFKLSRVPEKQFINSIGAKAKLILNGTKLPQEYVDKLHSDLQGLADKFGNPEPTKKEIIVAPKSKCSETIIADIEDIVDDFYRNNYKSDFSLYEFLSKSQLSKNQAQLIHDYYLPVYEDVKNNPADYLKTKTQHKSYVAFLKMLVDDSAQFIENKVATRKPRKKRAVKVEDKVKAVSYKKENVELKLASIKPEQIVEAKVAILFNDKYRYVTVYYAKDKETLQIKGTTILNFDPEKSFMKTVRKPETLHTLLSGTQKVILKNIFGIKAKEKASVSGRINSETLLLKAFK
jgi:hypothetical protein